MSTKFGIIGTGMMDREHIRNLQAIKKAEIVAIADPDDGSLKSANELFSEDMPPYYLQGDTLFSDFIASEQMHLDLHNGKKYHSACNDTGLKYVQESAS